VSFFLQSLRTALTSLKKKDFQNWKRSLLLLRGDFFAGDRPSLTLMGPSIRMRALPPNRQPAPVPETSVATDVYETLDIHGHFGAQGTFDLVVALDLLAKLVHIVIGQIERAAIRIHTSIFEDHSGARRANSI
jgi:hypothetical protein